MNFKNFLSENDQNRSDYKKTLLKLLKKYKNEEYFIFFSNEKTLKLSNIFNDFNFEGILGYPSIWVYKTLLKNEILNIKDWPIMNYVIVGEVLRGSILKISEYNNDTKLINDIVKLKKNFLSEFDGKNSDIEWNKILKNAELKNPKNNFKKLMSLIKQISITNNISANSLFKILNYSSILSDINEQVFKTSNPELCIFSSKNIRKIDILDNI